MARSARYAVVTILSLLLLSCEGFSSGYTGPCQDPAHGAPELTGAGLVLTVSDATGRISSYAPGGIYTLTLSRTTGTFKGWLAAALQGSSTSFSNTRAGSLLPLSRASQLSSGCVGAVTHTSSSSRSSVSWQWVAPAGTVTVTFSAVAVVSYNTGFARVSTSLSGGASASPSGGPPSPTPSALSLSPSNSAASATASPAVGVDTCGNLSKVWRLSGRSGRSPTLSSQRDGNDYMYQTAGRSCTRAGGSPPTGGASSSSRRLPAGRRLVFLLALDSSAPLGGTLTVTTCGSSNNATALAVGTGCPSSEGGFRCLESDDGDGSVEHESEDEEEDEDGNEDDEDDENDEDEDDRRRRLADCASNPRAASVTVSSVSSRSFFVQVGSRAAAAARPVQSGVSWVYTPPQTSASRTKSRSSSRSRPPASRTRTKSKTPRNKKQHL